MKQLQVFGIRLLVLLVSTLALSSEVRAEAAFPGNPSYLVKDCKPGHGYFFPTVPKCGPKPVCVELLVDCKFVDPGYWKQIGGDTSKLGNAPNSQWVFGFLSAIMCKPVDGICPEDRNACGAQPSAEIGCSLKDMDHFQTMQTVPTSSPRRTTD